MSEYSGLDVLFEEAGKAAIAAHKPQAIGHGGKQYVVVPDGYDLHMFEGVHPSRVMATVRFNAVESFAEYVNAYKGDEGSPLLLAAINTDQPNIKCVLDYHERSEARGAHPRWCSHRAEFVPIFSEQYARWRRIDEQVMSQAAFAEFIEEFCGDILYPEPASMMEIASDLEMSSSLEFKSKTNTQNGMVALVYVEDGKAVTKEGAEVPKTFRLKLPIFFGEEPVEFEVFLRFRAQKGAGLQFAIKIRDRVTMERECFLAAMRRVEEMTELTALIGQAVNIGD